MVVLAIVAIFLVLAGLSVGIPTGVLDPYALNYFNYYMGAQYFLIDQTEDGYVVYPNRYLSEEGQTLLYERLLKPLYAEKVQCDEKRYACFIPK